LQQSKTVPSTCVNVVHLYPNIDCGNLV